MSMSMRYLIFSGRVFLALRYTPEGAEETLRAFSNRWQDLRIEKEKKEERSTK